MTTLTAPLSHIPICTKCGASMWGEEPTRLLCDACRQYGNTTYIPPIQQYIIPPTHGWQCPSCKRCWSPEVRECECKGASQ